MIGGCCSVLLCCTNIGAIVTAGVFRYNIMGKWSALSLVGANYSGEPFDFSTGTMITSQLDDSRTYADDANLIQWCWITQMAVLCLSCCVGSYQAKPETGGAQPVNAQFDKILTKDEPEESH